MALAAPYGTFGSHGTSFCLRPHNLCLSLTIFFADGFLSSGLEPHIEQED
jgi:hypothetical protein